MTKIVYSCPAYDVIDLRNDTDEGKHLEIHDDMQLAAMFSTRRYGMQPKCFTAGSARGYAERYGEDPDESERRERERGFRTHWLNGNAVTLSNMKEDRKTYALIEPGDTVTYYGKMFRVKTASNQNLDLIEI